MKKNDPFDIPHPGHPGAAVVAPDYEPTRRKKPAPDPVHETMRDASAEALIAQVTRRGGSR